MVTFRISALIVLICFFDIGCPVAKNQVSETPQGSEEAHKVPEESKNAEEFAEVSKKNHESLEILEIFPNRCISNTCLNDGTCFEINGHKRCVCTFGWAGEDCKISKNIVEQTSPLEALKRMPNENNRYYYSDIADFQACYEEAIKFAKTHLVEKNWSDISAVVFLNEIQKMHQILVNLNDSYGDGWRKDQVFVSNSVHKQTLIRFCNTHSNNAHTCLQPCEQWARHELSEKKLLENDPEYVEICKKALVRVFDQRDISFHMLGFANKLLEMNKEKTDAFRMAAFAHQQLVKIHPFEDANGRIARLLANIILVKHGYSPVNIQNECNSIVISSFFLEEDYVTPFEYNCLIKPLLPYCLLGWCI